MRVGFALSPSEQKSPYMPAGMVGRRRQNVIERSHNVRRYCERFRLAIGLMVVMVPLAGSLAYLLEANNNSAVANIPPKAAFELVVFLALVASASFAEELVFRGYLTQQFSAWTGNRAIAVILQGILFGLAHGFYGKAMLAIMLQGWLLGLLAYWRKSLRRGMLAHGLQDSIGGLFAFSS